MVVAVNNVRVCRSDSGSDRDSGSGGGDGNAEDENEDVLQRATRVSGRIDVGVETEARALGSCLKDCMVTVL
jgi:hypothetical protein